jgi:hypothetical protein
MTAVVLAVCGRRFTVARREHRPEAVTAQAGAQVGGAAIVLLVLAVLDLIGSGGVTRLRTRSAVVVLSRSYDSAEERSVLGPARISV